MIESTETADTYFHITPTRNVRKIMRDGLTPKNGRRSRQIERIPAIFLFHSREDVENALTNWLGDEFGESVQLALLEVTVPDDTARIAGAGYEAVITASIPASAIKIITRNIDA